MAKTMLVTVLQDNDESFPVYINKSQVTIFYRVEGNTRIEFSSGKGVIVLESLSSIQNEMEM